MVSFKQEMPPQGGFNPVEWAQRGPKKIMSGMTMLGLFIGITALAWVDFYFYKGRKRLEDLEMRDARLAVEPFLIAERERALLMHYRRNRDEENELMKNVNGWKTGTLWGEPVFSNLRGRYIRPGMEELLAHMSPRDRQDFIWGK